MFKNIVTVIPVVFKQLIEIYLLTYHATDPFKIYNSMAFRIFT